MTPSVRARLVLAAGVIAYDLAAPRGHTLSEQVDRWLVSHPLLTWTVGGIVAAHTMNLIPKPELLDPIHLIFTAGRRWR
jgi:hypothetical protein